MFVTSGALTFVPSSPASADISVGRCGGWSRAARNSGASGDRPQAGGTWPTVLSGRRP